MKLTEKTKNDLQKNILNKLDDKSLAELKKMVELEIKLRKAVKKVEKTEWFVKRQDPIRGTVIMDGPFEAKKDAHREKRELIKMFPDTKFYVGD